MGVLDTIYRGRTQGYTCVFTRFPTESKEVETMSSSILQKGKLRLRELEEVARDPQARKWQSWEERAALSDISHMLPISETT